MTANSRTWGRTLAVLGAAFAGYVGLALGVTALSGDAILGAAVSNVAAFAMAILYRWRTTGSPLAGAPQPRAKSASFWVTASVALVVCWIAGQTAATWAYQAWGSAGFDAVNETKTDSPVMLVLVTGLFLAPLGEESLMRGIAYPALRRHWTPLASAFVTAMVFALLHGNVVQIALTVPLGILLAFVYEASQRLWPAMLMHFAFNLTAAVIPVRVIESIAHPAMIGVLAAAVVLLLFALAPGCYAQRERKAASTV